jgi:hypothetical protein
MVPSSSEPPPQREVQLPRPERRGSTRIHVGTLELILETARGAQVLICNDGRQARRWSLGLTADAALAAVFGAPAHPVHLTPPDVIALAPGGRVHGYVFVPLVPRIEIRRAGHGPELLAEILPAELSAEWDDTEGFLLRTQSPFVLRQPVPSRLMRVVVPIVLRNRTGHTVQVDAIPVHLTESELRAQRGQWFAPPRRLTWVGSGRQTAVRPLRPAAREVTA